MIIIIKGVVIILIYIFLLSKIARSDTNNIIKEVNIELLNFLNIKLSLSGIF